MLEQSQTPEQRQTDDPELARLAHAAHQMQERRRGRERDAALAELLLGVHGPRLTRLKNLINTHEARDLEDLVFTDLRAGRVRQRILDHFADEADRLDIGDPKVLSDIDDTALCALNDRRYPRGTVYPGLLALYQALDQGPSGRPFDTGDLTFLTARPKDAWGLIEGYSREVLRKAGISKMSMLSGGLRNLFSHRSMAARKLTNVRRYRRLFPEYRLVFLGDSGQGDVIVGEQLYARHGPAVRLVLIHDVVATDQAERQAYAERGIWFVDTYVGAALVAWRHGLISDGSLARVAAEAVADFERLRWDSPEQRVRMRELFERDLAALPD